MASCDSCHRLLREKYPADPLGNPPDQVAQISRQPVNHPENTSIALIAAPSRALAALGHPQLPPDGLDTPPTPTAPPR